MQILVSATWILLGIYAIMQKRFESYRGPIISQILGAILLLREEAFD